jgi:hypothetical protein
MTDKRVRQDFSTSRGDREFEIFMLPDSARKELLKIRKEAKMECEQLRQHQTQRYKGDLEAAQREIRTDRAAPHLRPWGQRRSRLSTYEVETLAERVVTMRNEREMNDFGSAHRQREDDFLAKHKEERMLREAMDRSPPREREQSINLKKDFDRSR